MSDTVMTYPECDVPRIGCPCRRPGYEQPEDSRPCDCDCHIQDEIARLHGDYTEMERRAIAVTRMWDALNRCLEEFEPDDDGVCGEFQERLDMAIDSLMKHTRSSMSRSPARSSAGHTSISSGGGGARRTGRLVRSTRKTKSPRVPGRSSTPARTSALTFVMPGRSSSGSERSA